MKVIQIMILLCLCITLQLNAQNGQNRYTRQIDSFRQCFENKDAEHLTAYLSAKFSLPTVAPEQTERALKQLFGQLPLISLTVKENTDGKVLIAYDFEQLGERTSAIHFNEKGNITKIELFDNLINESREQRSKQEGADAVQPIPDELASKYPSKKITIMTAGNYKAVGDLYEVGANKPVILLCHQANYNKYEYADIGPKLNEMGFNALAIDLTGGGTFAAHQNETIKNRGEIEVADRIKIVENEIEAAVNYLAERYNNKVIVWGSSYTATLVVYAAINNKNVKASISFSGFNHFGDSRPTLESMLPSLDKPFFMTSSKEEVPVVTKILKDQKLTEQQLQFIPNGEGNHGSKAIWNGQKDAEEYWVALKSFLNDVR